MNFDNITLLGNKNGLKKVVKESSSESKAFKGKESESLQLTAQLPKQQKTKLKRTRTVRSTSRVKLDVELGKPTYPYGLVYNYYNIHPKYVQEFDLPTDYSNFTKNQELFTGMGSLLMLSDQQLLEYLNNYRLIVIDKTKHYITQRLSSMCKSNTKTFNISYLKKEVVKDSNDYDHQLSIYN